MKKNVPSLLAAGLLLALAELGLTWLRGRSLFLTSRELLEYALSALAGLAACVLAAGAVLQLARASRHSGQLLALCAGGLSGWSAQLLTEGRRVRDWSLRPVVVLVLGLLAAALTLLALRALRRLPAPRPSWAGLGLAGALGCLLADALVLPRGYPAFHVSLLVVAVVFAAWAGLALARPVGARATRHALGLALGLLAAAPLLLWHLARQPNTSYAVAEKAPFTGKLMRPFQARAEPSAEPSVPALEPLTEPTSSKPLTLRDRDFLLITVDALRADTLRALGGHGLTPEIDQLAEQGMVFRRAYTPAPHTSYALASLLTAKFIKPVVELGPAAQDHATLPDLLRRYGYRTAAFYPPAIFFVDGARFQALQSRGFGFEYRKEMYAPADERVEQLAAYLAQSEPGHPLFVWMHLFEPHEPYDPPAAFLHDESARGRYDGEVAYSDAAIGKLVRLFLAQKPNGVIIITADHGEEFGDHGGSFHGSTLYDEQVAVPLVWFARGAVPAGRSDTPVELVDIASTILSAVGIPRDPRMRGDDLGAVLAGDPQAGPRFAFASVEERHMVSDGRRKVICSASEQHCQLFDLHNDPKEQHNLTTEQPALVASLRRELYSFLSSIARREALAVDNGVGFPEQLVRARLFAPGAGPDLVPLLADPRLSVRAASARILGELGISEAVSELSRLLRDDPESSVRDEAAVALLLLGQQVAKDAVVQLLARPEHADDGLSLRRRAALALAPHKEPRAAVVLSELALDEAAQEADRLRAVEALGQLAHPAAVPALIEAMAAVRLRESAARALGNVGGKQAADALAEQLGNERYPPARLSEIRALLKLADGRAQPQLARFLGMETSVPGGVRLLLESGALKAPHGASVLTSGARRGRWSCTEQRCTPDADAALSLPASARSSRVTLLLHAEANSALLVNGVRHPLSGGEQQLSFVRQAGGPTQLALSREGGVSLIAWVAYPESDEIPPPAPEPWDAGAPLQQ